MTYPVRDAAGTHTNTNGLKAFCKLVNVHAMGLHGLMTEDQATTLRDRLMALSQTIDTAVTYLDTHTGTYGAFYKIGLISAVGGLLAMFPGVGFATGALVAGGPIGVQTVRLIVKRA